MDQRHVALPTGHQGREVKPDGMPAGATPCRHVIAGGMDRGVGRASSVTVAPLARSSHACINQFATCCGVSTDKSQLRLWLNCNGAKTHSNTTEFVTIHVFSASNRLCQLWPKLLLEENDGC